mmetsp:Transcript_1354/g.2132  ORF Transcript_1354/g.2132 Transcript_1354/m.2132 type:complete len:96 (-) Transcript_1354:620-907(-)
MRSDKYEENVVHEGSYKKDSPHLNTVHANDSQESNTYTCPHEILNNPIEGQCVCIVPPRKPKPQPSRANSGPRQHAYDVNNTEWKFPQNGPRQIL